MQKSQKKLWIGLFVLAVLTPLGLIIPEKFKAGEAWGEWGLHRLESLIGYAPEGLKRLSGLWKSPLPAYSLGGEGASTAAKALSYIISGLLGVLAVGLATYLISRFIVKNGK